MAQEIDTTKIENLIESFEDKMEEGKEYTPEQCEKVISSINTTQELQAGLPLLLEKAKAYKEQADACDRNIKMWQESKKMWQGRTKAFMDTLEKLISKLNIAGKSLKANGVKLATSSRTSLEVDEEWLLSQYQNFAEALQLQLPDYIKVSLSVDKNKLFAHVKSDNTMLVDNPDKIHTKSTTSTSIK